MASARHIKLAVKYSDSGCFVYTLSRQTIMDRKSRQTGRKQWKNTSRSSKLLDGSACSFKTLRRAIKAGKLSARYPKKNKAEVSLADLEAWYHSLTVRPGETQERLTALEMRVAELEAEVLSLRKQLEAKKKEPPKPATTAPDGVWQGLLPGTAIWNRRTSVISFTGKVTYCSYLRE
jgi:hypothetical protein